MKEKENRKNKHMTLDDRVEIQECLNKGMTFKAIAQRIGKDPTTVSKEVKLHGKNLVALLLIALPRKLST